MFINLFYFGCRKKQFTICLHDRTKRSALRTSAIQRQDIENTAFLQKIINFAHYIFHLYSHSMVAGGLLVMS